MTQTIDLLLDAAEADIRRRGYHAVSFRQLADEIGIKSASIHYYFRQKEDLGAALVNRYSERFFQAVNAKVKNAKSSKGRVQAYCDVYREALVGADRICLCGMLGAESCGLPDKLAEAVKGFFEANIKWLENAMHEEMQAKERRRRASHILASLQGAMVLASSMKDHNIFEDTVRALLD